MRFLIALAFLLLPSLPQAETITFEADDDILVIRGFTTAIGWVQFDIVGSKDATVLCIAMDAEGKPLATTVGYAQVGYVAFVEIELDSIDRVACRYN